MNKYTAAEVLKVEADLTRVLHDDVEVLETWFEVSREEQFDMLVQVAYLDVDGFNKVIGRYLTK